ncbi:SufE family protein [Chitinibacter fontanus]|uniref:SufE family protein n=1 Tax=Chitinibacter fontanus TaxID=1737446 RepID=A0A7D5Z6X3_9NEIS|nr:SufE family protein [Chitinibacter fontanus]QLI83121.1 SufE family protein [Chitinibacter fontanus]
MTVNNLSSSTDDPRFHHPFGSEISLLQLAQSLDAAASWEAKNRLLVQLSKQLPDWPVAQKTADAKVSGCESQVWLRCNPSPAGWQIAADSDSRIVKGLLALVLTAFNQRSSTEIIAFDFEAWLNERGMQRFLSASRGNGLRAITEQIKSEVSR